MAMKLYVGGLVYSANEQELEALFAAYGAVTSAVIIKDRDSGRSKGFGFIEMADDTQAKTAMNALHGKEVDGRSLTVNEARPQEDRSFRGDSRKSY